jgi:hypothetical protein
MRTEEASRLFLLSRVGRKPRTEDKDTYVFDAGLFDGWKTASLRTVKQWNGTDSRDITFTANQTPWILNAGYSTVSQVSGSFGVTVAKPTEFRGVEMLEMTNTTRDGISTVLVEEKGAFTIHVKASGVRWWLKIGVE